MGKQFPAMLPEHMAFIRKQQLFFVGTAPMSRDGHVNLSPNETSSHLEENGRITMMFCAFQGPPNILRLYGTGTVILPEDNEWEQLYGMFESLPGVRQIIMVDIHKVQTSCGYAVPFMSYEKERETLQRWAEQKGEEGLHSYWREKNLSSLDGLPTSLGKRIRT
ncbi:pyridoxamine 5'-phosphate oxidase family protein [Paenibacillus sp. Dod16]|uniref:pyridoxamine 5'-phosphate oxidase family protein n=1 Tax=Paenibacillus sp. Dod16 TaxID=3416392 RepID=UPI003CE8F75A